MTKKKSVKIALWIFGIILILIVVASITLKLVFTEEKLLSLIEPRLKQSLQRDVEIKNVSLTIWGGLGVDVGGVTVYERQGFAQGEFLTLEHLLIRVKFFPLLWKRLEVKKIILEKPTIFLNKNKEGTLNIDDLVKEEEEFTLPPIVFEMMEIKEGKIEYFDQSAGSKIILDKIEQKAKLSFDPKVENGYAEGKIEIKSIDLNLPGLKKQIPEFYLNLEHDLKMNFPGDSVTIKKLKTTLGKVEIDITGKIENFSKNPILYLDLFSEKISLPELLASVPFEDTTFMEKLKSQGEVKISATFKGEPKLEPFPQIKGQVTFRDIKLESPDYPFPFKMPYGEINFDSKSASFFSSQAKLEDSPVEIKSVVDNYKDPNLSVDLKTKINLSLLEKLKSIPQGTEFEGSVDIDFRAYGRLKKMDEAKLSGKINLRKIKASLPSLGVPISDLNGELNLVQKDLRITNLFASLGKSSFSMDGKIENILPIVFKKIDTLPLLEFTLSSPYLDLDQIFPPDKKEQKPERVETTDTIPLPYLNLSGQVNVQKLLFREVEFSNSAFNINLTDGILRIDNFVSDVYTGNLGGKAIADLNDPEHVIFNFEVSTANLEANDFLSRFTPVKKNLFGKLNLIASFSGKGNTVDQIKNSLKGSGNAKITEGKFKNLKMLNLLSEHFKIDELKDQNIKTLKNSFRIEEGKLHFDDFSLQAKDFDCELSGYITLDGFLDYDLTLYLSQKLAKRFDLLGDIKELLKDEKERLVLDIAITGQASSPKFTLDTSRAQKRFEEKVKIKDEKLKKELEDKAKNFLKNLLEKK
ncbi:MAG: hypothetical protein AMJ90_07385 [candidate division Zixibacteria bacterium SM23_73_2]|nr:MAG: hypothetical protein AMJ90_07385 [candidate division Zixibacteria bacterium SM23_73_2]